MEDENEYKKLSTEDKCVHKLWKARVAGYEEAVKLFNQIDDEKSPEWNKYLGLIKKFVTDSNAVAQEKGMEAALVFVENSFHAGKTTGEVMSGIVAKCIAAPKTKTKDLALQLTLMYVEIEKQEVVQEELTKGMDHKNPKIVAACVVALTTALKQFGNKVITIKPLVKKIPALLTDRDKGVRDEGKALVVEMHRWIGGAMDPHIASLQAVVQQELRDAFAGNSGSATPTRYLRSQQSKMAEVAACREDSVDGVEEEEGEAGAGDSPDIDPYELVDPVEILSKLPKDLYDKLEAKKWQDRKEALDAVDNVLKSAHKLEGGDYADLVRALKKVISKDSNVMLVALAGRLLGALAAGLRNKFQPYAVACVSAILEKFKEKKTNVVSALRDAIDTIYPCTNLEAILEDVTEAFNNKNPSVKSETALFLARAFTRTQPAALNKKMLKAYVGGLLKLLESAEPTVRDAAAEALGTATKLIGEKNIAPHIGKLDNLKEAKIKEFHDKAVIQVKIAGPKKEARAKPAPAAKGDSKAGSAQAKPVKRPATAGVKKPAAGIKKVGSKAAPAREQELSQEEVDQAAEEIFTAEVVSGLQDGDWKTRLNAVRSFQQTVCGLSAGEVGAQVLLRTLNRKPGLRDTNMQVLRARILALKYVAENFPLSSTSVDFVLSDMVNRLGEATVMLSACDVLTTCAEAEACGLEHVAREALTYAMDSQKNPKVQQELFNWLSNAVKEFGMDMDIKPLIAHAKKAITATNPNVRASAVGFLGVLSMYVGPSLLSHLESEKPAVKQLIQTEMDKYANSARPSPVRGLNKSSSKSSMGEDVAEPTPMDVEEDEPTPAPATDTTARTDMALLITEPLLAEINDKNWKVRSEALEKLNNMISSAAPIKPSLGELPPALTARLLDSNSKLAQTALQICESLAVAMGTKCRSHVRTFFPAFFQALGDSKAWIRAGAVSCLDTWCAQAGGAQVALEGEMVLDALKAGSPTLRAELYQWIADNLPNAATKSFPREELMQCVPILYACIEDRAADVRKRASDCVLPFMLHLGYEPMHKLLDKLKPGSKSVVQAALDKARPNLPVQPLPSKGKKEDSKAVKSGGAQKKEGDKKVAEKKSAPTPQGKAKGLVKSASGSSRGRKDEDELAPLLPNNNAKNQRIVDDQKLKVLKWNFVTPREEFFELLKDQMLGTGFQKQLVQNMFHNDFRYHLKALESLADDLQDNGPELQANLDLVLKWLTLRFFDTNPSVILKGLEYLSSVFNYLIDSDYTMAEYEANCFIPYLVLKVGDPKDSVRNGVKTLFKQICVVYSVTKLFGYLMEGLKSKNARQRSECLECIGHLLETYGSGVMSPSLGVALKELARHIGDRDNAVRSAALNCIAHAYFLEGEKIYKMIGQVSDKELSLLEERIKRAAKSRSAEHRKSTLLPLSASGKPLARQPSDLEPEEEEPPAEQITVEAMTPVANDDDAHEPRVPATINLVPQAPAVVPGPFGLDPEVLARLEAQKPRTERTEMPPRPDTSFLDEPVPIPNFRPLYAAHAPHITNSNVMSPPHRLTAAHSFASQPPSQTTIDDTLLVDVIHSISNPNLKVASRGLKVINNALSSGRGSAFKTYEERLVQAVTQQIKQLRTGAHANDEAADTYRGLSAVLAGFYEVGGLGSGVSTSGVGALLAELLRVLSAADLPGGVGTLLEKRDADRLVRVLNVVCVRVLEHSQHTALLCALVALLHETIGQQYPAFPRYQELLLKCFWKTLKIFPSWDSSSIDYDTVLYKIHIFYKTYPASYWKKNSEVSDTPYRTVKTFVHTLVKMKGTSITNHLTQIPDAHSTDLYAYLLKVFQQLKLDEKCGDGGTTHGGAAAAETGSAAPLGSRLPRDVHEELIHVLKCIANKEQNQDALSKLLDIRERHPEVDIWSYMQGSSFYFRSYVERGLSDAAERRRLGRGAGAGLAHALHTPHSVHAANNNENENDEEDDENLHLVYMERLRKLQAQAGMPLSQPSFVACTPGADGKSLAEPVAALAPRSHNIDPQFELCAATQATHCSGEGQVDVEMLRLKLQQIKNASKR